MANDTVDTRVVRMEFDNKQFEKNVKQTSKSLDNLKDSLDFKGVGDGLDKVRVKISALEVAATTFVVRLTNKLITLGTAMVKSLSVDNIASGWAKFGEKTISVATMMAQKIRIAGEEITDVAEKTRVVNELLEKLTWFADETSYSLSDMTNYAGKFIAAGADLDKAVSAMQGIATWAALSGQNSQTASRAMMQLAQAMGRTINRQDWMSIQTANMDTEEFREKVLETAVALGTLTKEGDKFVTKTGKKFDKSGFMNYFSEGWFTSDVLIDTLNKYSAAVGEIYEISKREGITASEVIERYGDQLDKFGKKAFLASQQARTFADVLNSVKDAVTTKWMVTFENIFGGKDEAIKLWTKLSDRLYDVFAESGNFRNNVLSIWKEAKGRDDIFGEDGAFWNLYDAIDNIRLLIKKAWDTLFPISEMESEDARAKDIARTLKKITANIKEFTKNLAMSEETAKKISRIFEIFFGILKVGLYTLLAIRYALDPIIQTLKQLTNTILTKIAAMTGGINNVLLKIEKVANRVRETLWNLIDIINPKGTLDKVFSFIKALYNVISDFKPLERLVSLTDELFKSFREGGGTQENLIKIFKGLLSIISMLAKAFLTLAQALNKYILPILDKILTATAQIVGFITGVVVSVIAAISEVIIAINDALEGNANMSDIGDSFKNLIVNIGTSVAKILPILQSLLSIVSSLIDVILLIPRLLDSISIRLTGRGIIDNLKNFFDGIANAIKGFAENIQNGSIESGSSSILNGVFNALLSFINGLTELIKGLISIGNVLIRALGYAFKVIGVALQRIAEFLTNIFNSKTKELSKGAKKTLTFIAVLGIITGIVYLLYSVFYRFMAALDPLGSAIEGLVDVADRLRLVMLANAIKTIADAFLEFSISIAILSKVDSDMSRTIIMLGTIMLVIYALYKMIDNMSGTVVEYSRKIDKKIEEFKSSSGKTFNNLKAFTAIKQMLMAIGLLMLEIAATALIFDKLDSEKNSFGKVLILLGIIFKSVIGLFALTNLYVHQIKKDEKGVIESSNIMKTIMPTMLGIFAMIITIAAIAKQMDSISKEGFNKAMIIYATVFGSFLLLLTMVSIFVKDIKKKTSTALAPISDSSSNFKKVVSLLLAMSLLIGTFASSVILLSGISWDKLLAPMIGIGSLLIITGVLIAVLMNISKKADPAKLGQVMYLLIFLSGMILSLGTALAIAARQSWESITAAAAGMIAVLFAILRVTTLLMNFESNIAKANIIAGLLIMFSGTLMAIATSLAILSGIKFDKLGKSILALIGVLASIALLSIIMPKIGGGSSMITFGVALVVLSRGLVVFAKALRELSGVNVTKAAKGLKMIGISLVALVAISYISKSLIPVMLALSVVILTMSSSVLLLGTGLSLIAKTIDKLSSSGDKFKAFLINLSNGIMSMMNIILTGLATLIPKVLVMLITGLGQVYKALIDLMNTYAGPLAEAVLNLVTVVLEKIADHIDAIIAIGNRILYSLINGVLDFIKTYISPISDRIIDIVIVLINNIAKNLPRLLKSIVELLTSLTKMIGDIIPQIIKELVPAILDTLLSIWNAIMEAFGAEGGKITREEFMEVFGDVLRSLSIAAGTILKIIMKLIDLIDWDAIMDHLIFDLRVIAAILKILIPILNTIENLIMTIADIIPIELLSEIVNAILTPMRQVLQTITALLKGDMDSIVDMWGGLWERMCNGWETFKTNFKNGWLDWIKNALGDSYENAKNGALKWARDFGNGFISWINNMKAGFIDFSKKILEWFNNMKAGYVEFSKKILNIINVVENAFKGVGEFFKKKWQEFKDWGKRIVEGFVQGIKEGWNKLKNGVTQWANNIADRFKRFFGIHSPSKLFAQYGKYIVQGFGIGLEEESIREQSKFEKIAKDTLRSFENALFNNDNEYDYVMSIGMDISNVEKESAKVQDLMNSISSKSVEAETAYGRNASKLSSSIAASERANSKVDKAVETNTDNSINTTNNNVFNITSTDPAGAADEIDKILKKNAIKAKFAKGSV